MTTTLPGVNPAFTATRRVETTGKRGFSAFARRILRALGKRVGEGDIDALPDMLAMQDEVATAIDDAVAGLRLHGYSWADIGARIGITRQAAFQRWGGDR